MLEVIQLRSANKDRQILALLYVPHDPVNLPRSSGDSCLRYSSFIQYHSPMRNLSPYPHLHHELILLLQNRVLQNQKNHVHMLCQKNSFASNGSGSHLISMGLLCLRCCLSRH